jgi:hypothetical protein
MPEIVTLLLVPFVVGTAGGFLINWILEQSRANERRKKILIALHAQSRLFQAFPGTTFTK